MPVILQGCESVAFSVCLFAACKIAVELLTTAITVWSFGKISDKYLWASSDLSSAD